MREPGFYWVKRFNEWTVAYCNDTSWVSTMYEDEPIRDNEWQEIDELRIERNPDLAEIKAKKQKYVKMLEDLIEEIG